MSLRRRKRARLSVGRQWPLRLRRGGLPIIALLTDYGSCDWFCGSLKAAIWSRVPAVPIIDVTHEIAPGDICAGAFVLRACCRDFPAGTIFVAVVDPGVGSSRSGIIAAAGDYFFVGPDNGLLWWALELNGLHAAYRIENPAYFASEPSSTFHGRDIFAPVAAFLALGVEVKKFGPPMPSLVRLDWPQPQSDVQSVRGSVIYIDRFGNAITTICKDHLGPSISGEWIFSAGARSDIPLAAFYRQVPAGEPLAIVGSSGFVEISINGGSASASLSLKPGDCVEGRRRLTAVPAKKA